MFLSIGLSALFVSSAVAGSVSSCSTGGPLSCQNRTAVDNLCCFEYPGGLLLLSQLWNARPPVGPVNSWTVHGLWPDNCDGTYETGCDPSRAYTDIAGILTQNGASDTLAFMEQYWIDRTGANENFWEHEWFKHGTCLSTLRRGCLPDGSPSGREAVDYFQTVRRLFQSISVYDLLRQGGKSPTTSHTYSRNELLNVLKNSWGKTPALGCENGRVLTTIDFYFNLKGSIIDGQFIPIDAPKHGNCPPTGIRYLPKGNLGPAEQAEFTDQSSSTQGWLHRKKAQLSDQLGFTKGWSQAQLTDRLGCAMGWVRHKKAQFSDRLSSTMDWLRNSLPRY